MNLIKTMQKLTSHNLRLAWASIIEEAVQESETDLISSRKKLSIIVNEGPTTNIEIHDIRIPRISPTSRLAFYQPELTPIPSVRESFREARSMNPGEQVFNPYSIQRQQTEQSWAEEQSQMKNQALPLFHLLLSEEIYEERRCLRQAFDTIKLAMSSEARQECGQTLTPLSEVVSCSSPVFVQARRDEARYEKLGRVSQYQSNPQPAVGSSERCSFAVCESGHLSLGASVVQQAQV
jgi:hypothetical protein